MKFSQKEELTIERFAQINPKPTFAWLFKKDFIKKFIYWRNFKIKRSRTKNQKHKLVLFILILPVLIFLILTGGICASLNKQNLIDKNSNSSPQKNILKSEKEMQKELILINNNKKIEKNYTPDLIDCSGIKCERIIQQNLEKLLSEAKKQGYNLTPIIGYISFEEQGKRYEEKYEELLQSGQSSVIAEDMASKAISKPGNCELQTGLAILFSNESELNPDFEQTPEYKWLIRVATDYGFILRYPADKKLKTAHEFDSAHFRYVGIENAQKMRMLGKCLEEYCIYLKSK